MREKILLRGLKGKSSSELQESWKKSSLILKKCMKTSWNTINLSKWWKIPTLRTKISVLSISVLLQGDLKRIRSIPLSHFSGITLEEETLWLLMPKIRNFSGEEKVWSNFSTFPISRSRQSQKKMKKPLTKNIKTFTTPYSQRLRTFFHAMMNCQQSIRPKFMFLDSIRQMAKMLKWVISHQQTSGSSHRKMFRFLFVSLQILSCIKEIDMALQLWLLWLGLNCWKTKRKMSLRNLRKISPAWQ